MKHTEFFSSHGGFFAKQHNISSWNRIFSSRSRSPKICILSISKFCVYCCHSDIDFNKNCILAIFNSSSITGEKFVVIGQKQNYFKGDWKTSVWSPKTCTKNLKGNLEKANAYNDAINQYVEKRYAVEVKEAVDGDKKVRYLSFRAVFRLDKKTTKCRVDASAYDEHEVILNDCILSGPALQPNLVSVVEKMFLQIKVDERDQDALRYLSRDIF